EAIREARDALGRWSQESFTLLSLWAVFAEVEAELYGGRSEVARERLEASWPALKRSQLLRLQMYDVTMRDLAGRVALGGAGGPRTPRVGGRKRALRFSRSGRSSPRWRRSSTEGGPR